MTKSLPKPKAIKAWGAWHKGRNICSMTFHRTKKQASRFWDESDQIEVVRFTITRDPIVRKRKVKK